MTTTKKKKSGTSGDGKGMKRAGIEESKNKDTVKKMKVATRPADDLTPISDSDGSSEEESALVVVDEVGEVEMEHFNEKMENCKRTYVNDVE